MNVYQSWDTVKRTDDMFTQQRLGSACEFTQCDPTEVLDPLTTHRAHSEDSEQSVGPLNVKISTKKALKNYS